MNATTSTTALDTRTTAILDRDAETAGIVSTDTASHETVELSDTLEPSSTAGTAAAGTGTAGERGASLPADRHLAAGTGTGLTPQVASAAFDSRSANSFAVASFVLGLVSIVAGWSFFAPIVGLVLGILALRRKTGERTLALWGVWLNGALLALVAFAAVVMAILFGFAVVAAPIIGA